MARFGAATGRLSRRSPGGGESREAGSRLRVAPALGFPDAFEFTDRLTAGFFALAGTGYFRDTFSLDGLSASASVGPESATRPDETRNTGRPPS